jgi:hypothetical protein
MFGSVKDIITYFYSATVSTDKFLEFYKNLAPTDGWTVSHIGKVANHPYCLNQDCVMMKKGDAQIILFDDGGGIKVDYDRDHEYSPG